MIKTAIPVDLRSDGSAKAIFKVASKTSISSSPRPLKRLPIKPYLKIEPEKFQSEQVVQNVVFDIQIDEKSNIQVKEEKAIEVEVKVEAPKKLEDIISEAIS